MTRFGLAGALLLFCASLLLSSCATTGSPNVRELEARGVLEPVERQDALLAKERRILSEIRALVSRRDTGEKLVTETLLPAFDRLNAGELQLEVNSSLPRSVFGGAEFFSTPTAAVIRISPFLLTLYDTHPSLVYSVLVHELRHANDYFTQKEQFLGNRDNIVEHYLYEMDALFIEALFIKHYAPAAGGAASALERFLVDSLDADNLAVASLCFYGTDMDFTYRLQDLSKELKAGSLGRSQFADSLQRALAVLAGAPVPVDDEWKEYQHMVRLMTAYRFVPVYLSSIYDRPIATAEEADAYLRQYYPEIYGYLKGLQEPLSAHTAFMRDYGDRIRARFEVRD